MFSTSIGYNTLWGGAYPPKKLKSEFLGTVKSCTLGVGLIDTTLYIVYYFFFFGRGVDKKIDKSAVCLTVQRGHLPRIQYYFHT